MTVCLVPLCGSKIADGAAFCRACARLISDEEHRGLRTAYHAPLIGRDADELVVRWEEDGLPCFQRLRDPVKIADVVRWVEYNFVLREVAANICERRVKRLARLGRAVRTSADGGSDDDRPDER